MHGFKFTPMPVTHPGVEQKATVAADPPGPAGLCPAVGLGRHELDRRSRRRPRSAIPREKMIGVWWSGAEPDVRPAGRRRQGLQAPPCCSTAPASSASMPTSRSTSTTRARASAKRRDRRGALQSRPGQRHAGRRGDPHGADQVRQEAADRRAGALGLREPRTSPPRASRSWASRACCSRSRSPAPITRARAPAASSSGTASQVGRHLRLVSVRRQGAEADGRTPRPRSTRPRRSITPRDCSKES